MNENPWNLTPGECRVLAAVAEVGTGKGAGKILDLSHKTVEQHIHMIKTKMGIPHRLLAVLEYDRFSRGQS